MTEPIRPTAVEAQASLPAVLQLVAAGCAVSQTTRRAAAATVTARPVIDVLLSARRDTAAARRHFPRALRALIRSAGDTTRRKERRGWPGRWSHWPRADRQTHEHPYTGQLTGRTPTMKTMTCRQLGGPCALEHRGETADDVINAQDRHLKEAEKAGDATHQQARDAMKGRWRHPKKSMDWYRDMKKAFSELPED
jgi:hypothetical protein